MNVRVETSNDCATSNKNIEFRFVRSLEDKSGTKNLVGNSRNCCLEVSNRFGVTFILHNGNLRVVETSQLLTLEQFPPIIKSGVEIIALSCDECLVAITQGSSVHIYETKLFCQQLNNASPKCSFIVSKSGSSTKQLAWNPGDVRLIAALGADGTLLNVRVLDNWAIDAVSVIDASYRCISWSPKGKQLAVGGLNGIVQLKLDLKEAKKIPLPSQGQDPISIHWMSTLQFLVAFQPPSHDDLSLMLLTLSKTAETVYKNLGDAFLSDELADAKITYKFIPQWKLYLIFSSTTQEVLIAQSDPAVQTSDIVIQLLEDKYRAALPLDNYIQGAGIYLGHSESIVVNGEATPPWPLLLILLSQCGVVSVFHFINTGAESINMKVPEPININTTSIQGVPSTSNRLPPQQQIQQVAPQPAQGTNLNLFGQPPQSTSSTLGESSLFGNTTFNFMVPSSQPPQQGTAFGSALDSKTTLLSQPKQQPTTSVFTSQSQSQLKTVTPQQQQQPTTVPSFFGSPSFAPAQQQQQKSPLTLFGSSSGVTITPLQKSLVPEATPKSVSLDFTPQNLPFSQAGGGDTLKTSHSTSAFKPGQLPAQQEVQDMKVHLKTHDYKVLLDQLEKFEQRLAHFKSTQAQKVSSQSSLVKSYFMELDKKLRKDLNSMIDFSHNIVETTNGQREEIDGLCSMLQSHFSKIEYGLIASEKKLDTKYLKLLRSQPIDPTSLAKLHRVEKLFTYVSNQLKESRRHFYLKEQNPRPLDRTDTERLIYTTLQNHAVIIQYLNKITSDLRRQIGGRRSDQNFNGSSTDITLDDLASGINMLKIKTGSNDLMAQFKKTTVFTKEKIGTLRHWASQLTVTRVPVSGAIDPFVEVKPRRIRLAEEKSYESNEGCETSSFEVSFPPPSVTTQPASLASVFGSSSTSQLPPVPVTTQTSSLFGSLPPVTTSSLFGASFPITTAGGPQSTVTTPASAFGGFSKASVTPLVATPLQSTSASSFFSSSFAPPAVTTSASASVFGGGSFQATPVTTSTSIFGAPLQPALVTKPPSSAFGGSFTSPTTTSASVASVTSVFGGSFQSAPATTSASIFGDLSLSSLSVTTTSSSVLGTSTPPQAPTSLFGTSFPPPAVTTQSASIFGSSGGSSQVPPVTTQASLFGSLPPVTTSSLFGSLPPVTTSSLFGASLPITTAGGSPSTVTATSASAFEGFSKVLEKPLVEAPLESTPTVTPTITSTTTSTTSSSFFSSSFAPPVTTSASASVFGGGSFQATPVTTSNIIFGAVLSPALETKPPSSAFGGSFTSPTTTSASVFGGGSFQGAPVATSASIFGGGSLSPPSVTTASSILGSSPQAPASLFQTSFAPPSVTTQSASIFGGGSFQTAPVTTAASIFGGGSFQTAPVTTAASIFGGGSFQTAPVTTAASIFGGGSFQTAPVTTAASIFGGGSFQAATTSTSIFGGGSLSPPSATTTPSVFGASPAQAQPSFFGSLSSPTPAAPQFGQSQSSPFGGNSFGQQAASSFASPPRPSATAFGGAPVFGGGAVFGGLQPFGSTSPQQLSFGSGSIFGGGGGQVAGSAFGSLASAAQNQNTSVFGSGGTFGGSAADQQPSFGSFGGGAGFGQQQQQASSFGSFGQQQPQPQQQQQQQQQKPSFGSGSSFSSWR